MQTVVGHRRTIAIADSVKGGVLIGLFAWRAGMLYGLPEGPKNVYKKLTKMPEFYIIFARKISKIPEFFWNLPEKLSEFPNFTWFLPEKCPNFT